MKMTIFSLSFVAVEPQLVSNLLIFLVVTKQFLSNFSILDSLRCKISSANIVLKIIYCYILTKKDLFNTNISLLLTYPTDQHSLHLFLQAMH